MYVYVYVTLLRSRMRGHITIHVCHYTYMCTCTTYTCVFIYVCAMLVSLCVNTCASVCTCVSLPTLVHLHVWQHLGVHLTSHPPYLPVPFSRLCLYVCVTSLSYMCVTCVLYVPVCVYANARATCVYMCLCTCVPEYAHARKRVSAHIFIVYICKCVGLPMCSRRVQCPRMSGGRV